ncbi:MAG: 4Fe-4S binding protein, partial [Ignavibacteriales bacterium]|nr:4Fe-4S binding protein [Ignavibacteriales bacterium]
PTKAVTMVPYNKLKLPEIKEKICIGCGACEYACPVKPYKAIYVEGNRVHCTAESPSKENATQKEAVPEEFPF